jgi:predicted CoA-binding protein
MSRKKTLVLGASPNAERYSWKAVMALQRNGHEVVAVGSRDGKIGEVEIQTGQPPVPEVDTVTLYVGGDRQEDLVDYILQLKPKRLIFNPGTENPVLKRLALEKGIEPLEACTLVMLSIGNY